VGADFAHAQAGIQKQRIQTNLHAEGMYRFARVNPQSGVSIQFRHIEQTATALSAVGSGMNPGSEDTLACQILDHESGLRGASHDELCAA